jgi:pimeloyl-ACP methyl ester carboxylesterase
VKALAAAALVLALAAASIAGALPVAAAKSPPRIHPECVRARDHAKAIRFRTADGLRLAGVLLGKGSTGVVLAHQLRSDLCEWMPFARVLASMGFRVLAFDFRGYGASSPRAGRLSKDADVVAAARALRAQGVRDVALVGGSMGGTAVLTAGAELRVPPRAVVGLSSPAEFAGMNATAAVAKTTAPLLLVVSRDDADFVPDQHTLFQASTSPDKRLELLPGREHGAAILSRRSARALVLAFLESHRS